MKISTRVNEELTLDQDVLDKLQEIATTHNATLNEVLCEILDEFVFEQLAKKIKISDLKKLTVEELKENMYMLVDNEKEIAKIIPIIE